MDIKKVVKIICLVIVLIVLVLAILYFVKSGKLEKKDETAQLKSRVSQEIKFLDDYIFSIANSANNINLENYILKSETISGQTTSENSNQQSNQTSGGGQDSQGGQSSGRRSRK